MSGPGNTRQRCQISTRQRCQISTRHLSALVDQLAAEPDAVPASVDLLDTMKALLAKRNAEAGESCQLGKPLVLPLVAS